ncbi:MAG: SMP-30/gluconolactonase/LRE family protein [Sandaracinus sp.]
MTSPLRFPLSARAIALTTISLAACDPASPAPDAAVGDDAFVEADAFIPRDAPTTDAGPPIVEIFAALPASSEGIALGHDAAGASRLFVAARNDSVVSVAPDGTVETIASIRNPVGIAFREPGEIVACASSPEGHTGLFSITLDGTVTELTTAGPDGPYGLTNFVTVAPDGSLVFSDSMANRLYRADADGTNVALVTDTIEYTNGLAFSADETQLFVASWSTTTLYALPYAGGTYGAPTALHEGVLNIDGLATHDAHELVLVTSSSGVLTIDPTMPGEPRVLTDRRGILVPANGVFGDETFGTDELFVTSLGRESLFVVHTALAR